MHISFFLPSLNGGGAERITLVLAEGMLNAGHSVDLVLMQPTGEFMKNIPTKVRLIDLKCPRLWTSTPSLMRYLRNEHPDVLIAAMPLANGIAVWARLLTQSATKIILTEHNSISLVFGDIDIPRYRILQLLIAPMYPLADAIIAVSKGVSNRLKSLPRVLAGKVHMVYNPAYTPLIDALASEPLNDTWMNEKDIPVILSVGRLVKQKDYPTLIHAIDLIRISRPVRLIILGEDQDRHLLESLISKLNLSDIIRLPGFVSNPWAWMSRASVFVLSSLHEGLPTVLIEAMACGTPVVSTDCPSGPAEILEDGKYGILVPVGDSEALADAILQTLDNPISANILKSRAKYFSESNSINGYLEVISNVL
jgi:glycosyltransferase involved in cell wall biosynthesis